MSGESSSRGARKGQGLKSRRSLAVIAALEASGHTNVKLEWEPIGPAAEMCGHSGGYLFTSDQQRGVIPLGLSMHEALANVPRYAPKRRAS